MASEGVNRSGPSHNFTTVPLTLRDEVFLSSHYGSPRPVDDQRVAALDNDHVLVICVYMFRGGSVLSTRPERHLASIGSIEDVALDAGSGLIELSNLVRWVFHESGKIYRAMPANDCLRRKATGNNQFQGG